MSGTSGAPAPGTVHELYESLLLARDRARQRLLTIQQIERPHRDTSLADLSELAVRGALRPLTGREVVSAGEERAPVR